MIPRQHIKRNQILVSVIINISEIGTHGRDRCMPEKI
jgi:hypothetical protein